MPQFTWTGRDQRQVVRSGVIEAPSARQALRQLARASLAAVAVLPLPHDAPASEASSALDLRAVGMPVMLDAVRQLVHLLRQGVEPGRACAVAGASTPHAGLSEALHRLGSALAGGAGLEAALGAWPGLFDPLARGLIRAGEGSGDRGHGWAIYYQYLDFEHTVCPHVEPRRWERLQRAFGWAHRLPARLQRLRELTRVFGWLALGQRAGLDLTESLERAASHLGGHPLAASLTQARQALAAGAPLGAALCGAGLAPLEARPLLDHAQQHGSLDGTLTEMVRQYQQHLENARRG